MRPDVFRRSCVHLQYFWWPTAPKDYPTEIPQFLNPRKLISILSPRKGNWGHLLCLKNAPPIFPIMIIEDFSFLFSIYPGPILEHGSQIVHAGLIRDRDCLERFQRVSTKLVKSFFNLTYSARLSKLNLHPLESLRTHEDLMFLFHLFLNRGGTWPLYTHGPKIYLRIHDKKLILTHCGIRDAITSLRYG